jgi:hypothetical protein
MGEAKARIEGEGLKCSASSKLFIREGYLLTHRSCLV